MEQRPDDIQEDVLNETQDFGVVDESPSSLDELLQRKTAKEKGVILRVPSGLKFRVIRPSVSTLIKSGQMPNALIGTAINQQKGFEPKSSQELKDVFELVDYLVKMAVKEPELNDELLAELEDDDKFVIFNYVMGGVESLKSFRDKLQRRDN